MAVAAVVAVVVWSLGVGDGGGECGDCGVSVPGGVGGRSGCDDGFRRLTGGSSDVRRSVVSSGALLVGVVVSMVVDIERLQALVALIDFSRDIKNQLIECGSKSWQAASMVCRLLVIQASRIRSQAALWHTASSRHRYCSFRISHFFRQRQSRS